MRKDLGNYGTLSEELVLKKATCQLRYCCVLPSSHVNNKDFGQCDVRDYKQTVGFCKTIRQTRSRFVKTSNSYWVVVKYISDC